MIKTIIAAIMILQPNLSAKQTKNYATAFDIISKDTETDPLLLAVIAQRESSYQHNVVGRRGEIGLMQIMPRGVARRFSKCDIRRPYCNIKTGARYLAFVRRECPGTRWRWVAAYGWSRCPSEREARRDTATQRAYNLYCSVNSKCSNIWNNLWLGDIRITANR